MFNALGGKVFLTTGPVFTKTSIIRSLSILSKDEPEGKNTKLRQDEMLYDHAFNIIRNFLIQAAHNSVEDCQKFSNIKTPSPPWVRVIHDRVAVSSCDQAATYLIKAFGGEAEAKRVVGGVHWWQVRGVQGVDAQWIIAKKDHEAEEKKQKSTPTQKAKKDAEDATYHSGDDDAMRCILYIHGGGYYFGSVDQERYSTQRNARKISGRVFSINYRLAPQYPFPCAIQDALAAYLYLIRPPADAKHKAINPNHITVYGDSAGGGITFALLQLLRDNDLPAPAGAVIVSPWCDLTHSFPSIHTNTDTDVLPVWGLSMQKPSTLWPPPTYEMTDAVHASLRDRLRNIVHLDAPPKSRPATRPNSRPNSVYGGQGHGPDHGLGQNGHADPKEKSGKGIPNVGATVSVPPLGAKENQRVTLKAQNGETLTIDQQIHLYTQNSLLTHPLVSPALSYLGGLPPMLIIAGDGEVLRDEIIYTAHKAAHPDKFKISDEAKDMYPPLRNIEGKYSATEVHLQVYDDAAHVLPILFFYTTAAKYCFRAMATFTKYVSNQDDDHMSGRTRGSSFFFSPKSTELASPDGEPSGNGHTILNGDITEAPAELSPTEEKSSPKPRASTMKSKKSVKKPQRSNRGERLAGDPIVYSHSETYPSMAEGGMIRERVSIKGVVRPLEPQEELQAFTFDHKLIGVLSELAIRRYIDARDKFAKKYKSVAKRVEQTRRKNLAASRQDIDRNVEALKTAQSNAPGSRSRSGSLRQEMQAETLDLGSGRWNWAWALQHDERPPPSSIVSRRDTVEARNLARVADQAVLESDGVKFSGNNIWAVMVQALQKKNAPDNDAELAGEHHPRK